LPLTIDQITILAEGEIVVGGAERRAEDRLAAAGDAALLGDHEHRLAITCRAITAFPPAIAEVLVTQLVVDVICERRSPQTGS
jgi:hypothetical protein